jgi:hypothetical protein
MLAVLIAITCLSTLADNIAHDHAGLVRRSHSHLNLKAKPK